MGDEVGAWRGTSAETSWVGGGGAVSSAPVLTQRLPLQIESGFFHESDVKIVAKSIRDRVALIQWRQERIWPALQPTEQRDPGSPDKARGPPAPLQVQVTYHTQAGPPEPEEPEVDQHLLPSALPASATSLACECHPPCALTPCACGRCGLQVWASLLPGVGIGVTLAQ